MSFAYELTFLCIFSHHQKQLKIQI